MQSSVLAKILVLILISSCSGVALNPERRIASNDSKSCKELVAHLLKPADFLHRRDNTLQNQPHFVRIFDKLEGRANPRQVIAQRLYELEEQFQLVKDNPRYRKKIELFFHKKYIIKAQEVPESYFEAQKRMARNQGHGNLEFTESTKAQQIEVLQNDQKASFDTWFSYMLSDDSNMYPPWLKLWSLEEMSALGKLDIEKGKFSRRTTGTVAPFPELNREAYSKVIDSLLTHIDGKSLDDLKDKDFAGLLKGGAGFGRLYGQVLKNLRDTSRDALNETTGKWIKYSKGSNPDALVKSLDGKGTGWCTAGHATAKEQLQSGDFHVFYSKDEFGQMTNPRLAIRMEDQSIAEVRGVANDQNIDEFMAKTTTLDKKLEEFGSEGVLYQKKSDDMKQVTEIMSRFEKGEELLKDDLRFLYEIDRKIEGFGYETDPRILEMLQGRNQRDDLSRVFDCRPDQISFTKEEALSGDIVYHKGSLLLPELEDAAGVDFPRHIGGQLSLDNLKSGVGLVLPSIVDEHLNLINLTSGEGVVFPKFVGGKLELSRLTTNKGLSLGDMNVETLRLGIISAEGVDLSQISVRSLQLSKLESVKGLTLPKNFKGDFRADNLETAEGLVFPETLEGSLFMTKLKSGKGIKFPKEVKGVLSLQRIKSAEGLVLPEVVGRSIHLHKLESAKGLNLPLKIGEDINLNTLKSAEGLKLPKTVEGRLNLEGLTSIKGLKLPRKVKKVLLLSSLKKAGGLILPEFIGGSLDLDQLESLEGVVLPKVIKNKLGLRSLTSFDALKDPSMIGDEIGVSEELPTSVQELLESRGFKVSRYPKWYY